MKLEFFLNDNIEILKKIENLKQEIGETVNSRIQEFKDLGSKGDEEIFKELCFCILTANYSAEGGIRIQNEIGNGFLTLPEESLKAKLKQLGYRFPDLRGDFIIEARKHYPIKEKLESFETDQEVREWIVENVKGLGYKESSHFLRNIGFDNLAIIDFHIIDLLVKEGLIEKPKTLTKKIYLEIESLLKEIAAKSGLKLSELDLYLWFIETGKILK